MRGGPGNDAIEGNNGADLIDGGPGNDSISAGGGDDDVTGGAGSDSFTGSDGNDVFRAEDDEADASFSGGPGTDTVYIDGGLDPAPVAVEIVIPEPPPPPPPPGNCSYDATAKKLTATIAAGTSTTLVVVGGAIHFGSTPTACGTATVNNTDTIVITAPPGSTEGLTIDQTGGAFAPGATAESTGVSEIEVQTSLGDASDTILVLGTSGNDTLVIGTTGIGLTGDSDADATYSPARQRWRLEVSAA